MPLIARRYFQAFSGITMIGVGVAFNYMADLGLGPWGVLHDGISKTIRWFLDNIETIDNRYNVFNQ